MNWKRLFMLLGVLVLAFGLVACDAAEEEDPFADPGIEDPLVEEDPLLEEEPLVEEPFEDEPLVEEEPLEEEVGGFDEFDVDDDEYIDADEFDAFLADNELGFDETDADLFTEFDENEDLLLTEEEFDTFLAEGPALAEDEAVEEPLVDEEIVEQPGAELEPIMLSENLIGMQIVSDFTDVTAEVDEVLIDEQGMIRYVVFDTGGFLDIGDRSTAVDWDLFQVNQQDPANVVVLFTGTAEDLEAAPEVDMALLDQADLVVDATALGLAEEFDGMIQVSELHGWDLLDGWDLTNFEGEDIGAPEQFVMNLIEGQATYLIADTGIFLGIEENETAIPWRLVTVDEVDQAFIVPVEDEVLEIAPTFPEEEFETAFLTPGWDAAFVAFWQDVQPIEAAGLEQ